MTMEGGSCTRAPLPTPGVLAQAPRGARLVEFDKRIPYGSGKRILRYPRRANIHAGVFLNNNNYLHYTTPPLFEERLPTGCRSAERGQEVRKALDGQGVRSVSVSAMCMIDKYQLLEKYLFIFIFMPVRITGGSMFKISFL